MYADSKAVWSSGTSQKLYPLLLPELTQTKKDMYWRDFHMFGHRFDAYLGEDTNGWFPRWYGDGQGNKRTYYMAWDKRGYAELRHSLHHPLPP